MNSVSRKDFLRLTSLSFLAALLPVSEVNALSFILSTKKDNTKEDFAKAVELSKTAKKYFYQKQFKLAEETYMQCIKLAPAAVRFYDGLDNVFGAQGKFLECLLLYKNGLEVNSNKIAFYDRSARALARIEVGYKKIPENYKEKVNSKSLLEDALALYDKAIKIDNKPYLSLGKNKIQEKINFSDINLDKSKKIEYRIIKRKKAIETNLAARNLPVEKLILQYSLIDKKDRIDLYFKKELSVRQNNIDKLKKRHLLSIIDKYLIANDYENAFLWSKELFRLDVKYQHGIVRLKNALQGLGKFNDIVNYRLQYAKEVQTVYAYIGVLDAIQKSMKKKQHSTYEINIGHQIGEDLLKNWGLMENVAIDVIDKYNKILVLDGKVDVALKITEKAFTRIKTTSDERINKLVLSYSNLLVANGNYDGANRVLKLSLKEELEDYTLLANEDLIKKIIDKKQKNSFVFNKPIYFQLYKNYKLTGRKDLETLVLNTIKSNGSNEPFLKNKLKP
jgi:hypothetical protein